jgi:hypothetical protein
MSCEYAAPAMAVKLAPAVKKRRSAFTPRRFEPLLRLFA